MSLWAWIELWLLQNFLSQIFSEPAGLSKTEQSSSRREWVRFGSPTDRDSQRKSDTGYNQHQASRPVMLILLLPSNCWSLWAGGDVRLLFVSSRRCSTHLFFFVFLFFHIAFGASVSASSLCTHRRLNSLQLGLLSLRLCGSIENISVSGVFALKVHFMIFVIAKSLRYLFFLAMGNLATFLDIFV